MPLILILATFSLFSANGQAAGTGVVDFSQCANGASGTSTSCSGGWINGNLQSSNSHYHEDEVVAQRLVLNAGGTSTGQTVTINYDTKKGNVHAYDSLATWNYTVKTADICQGLAISDCPGGDPSTFPIPDDPTIVPPSGTSISQITTGHMIPAGPGRVMVMYGGVITGISVPVHNSPSSNDDSASVTITYDVTNSNGKVMILFGGHLAAGALVHSWGAGLGASAISGNFHVKLSDFGSRDNQVATGTILKIPGNITIKKVTIPNPDPTNTAFGFTSTFFISSSFNVANGEAKTFTVESAKYTVTENDPSSAAFILTSITCLNDDGSATTTNLGTRSVSITLGNGGNVNCTFTNNLQMPNLVIVKHVINDNGGTKSASDFTMNVAGTNVQPASSFPGSETGAAVTLDAGSYSVSETGSSGYSSSSSADCSGSITYGQSKNCTITNNDIAPKLTVTKVVINDNGGIKVVSGFPLFVDATPVASGVQITTNAGIHTVSETNQQGYAATVSGDCNANGAITLNPGDVKSCTITNNDIAPKLTVTKVVINDNGGIKVVSGFPLFVDATPVASGVQITTNAGAHTVSETNRAGYTATISGDCGANGAITLNPGDVKACTITNDDIQPILHVIKHVINDNGGNNVAADWTMTVTGGRPSPASFPGNESGTTVNLNGGSYSVSESGPSGYTESDSSGCSGSISVGQEKTCTITNNDKPAKITLIKDVINDNGGNAGVNDFGLTIGGTPVSSGGSKVVNSNTPTAINEAGLIGYTFVSITGAGCPGSLSGTATLNEGQEITCTITNNDQPASITLIKQVTENNGGTAGANDFGLSIDGSGAASGSTTNVNSNTAHTIDEVGLAGYSFVSITGDAKCPASLEGTVTLDEGEHVACTITNDDQPAHIIVIKHVINDNLGTKVASNFQMHITGTAGTADFAGAESPGVNTQVNAGTFSVTEDFVTGYASSTSDDCSGTTANGETKTCTITNNDIAPKLTVIKHVTNDNGGNAVVADFPLFVGATSVTSGIQNGFNADTYTVSETPQTGYAASVWSGDCAANGAITLNSGDVKTCEITNDDQPAKITLIKNVINNNGGTAGADDFGISIDGGGATSGSTHDVNSNTAHTINEAGLTGYGFVSITGNAKCPAVLGGNTANLNEGEEITCTINNDDIAPSLTLNKIVINDNGGTAVPSDWTLTASGPILLSGPGTAGSTDVASGPTFSAGTYTLSESVGPSGYSASSWSCVKNGRDPITGSSISLDLGDTATCTITNDDQPGTLIVKKIVINDNGGILKTDDFQFQFLFQSNNGAGQSNLQSFEVDGQNDLTVLAGTYYVTEPAVSGYTTSYDNCEGIVIPNGGTATCTIINDDIQPTLKVVKIVTNDNGGSKTVEDFPLFVGQNSVTSGEINGFNAGTYTISETNQFGYAQTSSGDCDSEGKVTLAVGDAVKTCFITNDDIASKLTLVKTVVNDNGGTKVVSDFQLFIDGNSVTSDEQNIIDAGLHTVSETGDVNYTASFSGDCNSNGTIILSPGDNKVCTITNNDKPGMLTIIKHVINDNSGTNSASNFTIHITGKDVSNNDFSGSETGTTVSMDSGAYIVDETGPNGYNASFSPNCFGTIGLGEQKMCTITNDYLSQTPPENDNTAKLVVIKHVVNDNIGTATSSDFTMHVTGSNVSTSNFAGDDTGTTVTLTPDLYSVDETGPDGYTPMFSSNCFGTISIGETRTCTIVNDDNVNFIPGVSGRLVVFKHVINDNGGTKSASDFNVHVTGSNPSLNDFAGSETGVQITLNVGSYIVDESGPNNYIPDFSTGCVGNIGSNQLQTCTIINDDTSSEPTPTPILTVIKHVINDNGGSKSASDFAIIVNTIAESFSFPGSQIGTALEISEGNYNVNEVESSGYTSSFSSTCSDTILNGERKTCTITNNDQSSHLIVIKHVINDNGGTKVASDFNIHITGTAGTSNFAGAESPGVDTQVNAGAFSVTEDPVTGYTSSTSGNCSGTIVNGETKTCIITNDDAPPTSGGSGGSSPNPPPPDGGISLPPTKNATNLETQTLPGSSQGSSITISNQTTPNATTETGQPSTPSESNSNTGNGPPTGFAILTPTNLAIAIIIALIVAAIWIYRKRNEIFRDLSKISSKFHL